MLHTALAVLAFILAAFVAIEVVGRLIVALGCRTPCPRIFGAILTSPLRRHTFGPKWTFDAICLPPGGVVLELGTGVGALSPEASRRIGPSGLLVGLDIQQAMLRDTRRRLNREGVTNAALVRGDGQSLPFRSAALDAIFLVTVLGEIPDARRALAEMHRVLRPGGFVAVTEILPDPHYRLPGTVAALMRDAGLVVEPQQGGLFAYTLRGAKPDS